MPELMAALMHTLLDVGTLRLDPGVPRELSQLIQSAEPIPGLC